MAPFLSKVAVLLGAASAVKVHTGGDNAANSVSQIRDTLHNLLKSIEDNGHDSEALSSKKQEWCDTTMHNFDVAMQAGESSVASMKTQLTETLAEMQEAQGTVQQVKVDIEMAKHTLKQTEDMLRDHADEPAQGAASFVQTRSQANAKYQLEKLAANKRLSLASLEQELQVAIPVLAQLQANVAETKERISYRTDSLSFSKDFATALKDECQKAADRADTQAAARIGESNSIHAALQALSTELKIPESANDDASDSTGSPSFLQVGDQSKDVTVDDLSDLFAADQTSSKSSPMTPPHVDVDTPKSSMLRPRIQSLLSQLKNDGSRAAGTDQAAWCSQQREASAMALKFAHDSVAQVSSQMDAHAAAESELNDELQKLKTLAASVTDAGKTVLEHAAKEKSLVQSSEKDEVLATKILDQALTILRELGLSDASKTIKGLDSAQKTLKSQLKAVSGFEAEAIDTAKVLGEKAVELTKTQESEQHNLELARDDHTSQRLNGVSNKHLYEADVQEATAFAQKLEADCQINTEGQVQQQHSAQVHALDDAGKALDGNLVEAKSTASNLRGPDQSHAATKVDAKNLTPMQRAAMEMGISTD